VPSRNPTYALEDPDDDVRGLALTPNGSQLLAADFGSQNVYVLDPDLPTTPATAVSLAPTGYGPTRIAATGVQTAFVALSAEVNPETVRAKICCPYWFTLMNCPCNATTSGVCSSCVSQPSLSVIPPSAETAPQASVANITGAPIVQRAACERATGHRIVESREWTRRRRHRRNDPRQRVSNRHNGVHRRKKRQGNPHRHEHTDDGDTCDERRPAAIGAHESRRRYGVAAGGVHGAMERVRQVKINGTSL
jgi:hypothetical protein